MVIYCKSVHFNGFEDAVKNLSFYEMSSFKEGIAMELAEESGEEYLGVNSLLCFKLLSDMHWTLDESPDVLQMSEWEAPEFLQSFSCYPPNKHSG